MVEPKTSEQTASGTNSSSSYEEFNLDLKDEEEEIARLGLPATDDATVDRGKSQNVDRTPKIDFQCTSCSMREMVHYYGKSPPFVYGLRVVEDSFIVRDPFQPPPMRWKPKAEYFVLMGAKCSMCKNVVCKRVECSFYYTRTYCLNCAKININKFPIEAQAKLRKQLAKN
ncbi:cysteine-rich DPF motif domain-containing protein 1 [Eurosta solidaginis]|uniref:cysteine-rich DPF motif domain-containing protein 1 n=1 Tax=Eurosta solidaginis TaxID=178769 RepID=UPI003530A956